MGSGVLVVDGHLAFADAVASLLRERSPAPVVTASTEREALAHLDRRPPEIAVVAALLTDGDGIDLVERMLHQRPSVAVVVLGDEDAEQAVRAIRAGASAFVPKTLPSDDLIAALAAVGDGGAWLPTTLLGPVLRGLVRPPPKNPWETRLDPLTARELEILDLMVTGCDRSEIGRRLGVSLNTVRTHTRNMLAKLAVHSSLEAVSVARRAGRGPRRTT